MAFYPPLVGRERARLLRVATFGQIEVTNLVEGHLGPRLGPLRRAILAEFGLSNDECELPLAPCPLQSCLPRQSSRGGEACCVRPFGRLRRKISTRSADTHTEASQFAVPVDIFLPGRLECVDRPLCDPT